MKRNNIKPEDLHAANTAAFLVSSVKRQADKASSGKRQAPSTEGSSMDLRSCKRQAPSRKSQAPSPVIPHKVSSD